MLELKDDYLFKYFSEKVYKNLINTPSFSFRQTGYKMVSINIEKLVLTKDADYIFSIDLSGWEEYVLKKYDSNDSNIKLMPCETGTAVLLLNNMQNIALLVQPLFKNEGPPQTLIIRNYYACGELPEFHEKAKSRLKMVLKEYLGTQYSVAISHFIEPRFEVIELRLKRI